MHEKRIPIATHEKNFWCMIVVTSFLALALGGLLFLIIPRAGSNSLSAVPGIEQPQGAFPDVALDKTGKIELDPSLLFIANLPQKPEGYYWRIDVQNIFDGTKWRTFFPGKYPHPKKEELNSPPYTLKFVRDWRDYRLPTIANTVLVEHSEKTAETAFIRFNPDAMGLWKRWGWRRGAQLKEFQFWIDENYQYSEFNEMTYDVLDEIYQNLGLRIKHSGLTTSQYFNPRYIWPGRLKSTKSERERLSKLIDSMIGDAKTDREKADRIRDALKTQYRYTLERPERHGNIVEDFLFVQKEGHCEVFSTAMAVLLAQLDIPVRNVSGFASSEYQDGNYKVRLAHAHSWVEVLLDGKWVIYDPTPSGTQQIKVDWLLQMDDWFASYRPQNIYSWIIQHGLYLLLSILAFAILGIMTKISAHQLHLRIIPTSEVWKWNWDILMKSCSNDEHTQALSKQSLEDWWHTDLPDYPELKSFAIDYIKARYDRPETISKNKLTRIRYNHSIIQRRRKIQRLLKKH